MTVRENLQREALKKAGMSLVGVNALVTNSFEMEHIGTAQPYAVKARLQQLGGGTATSLSVNDGNGWNDDTHQDGTVWYNELVRMHNRPANWYDVETSSSPLHATSFKDMRDEIKGMMDLYEEASEIIHSRYASSHVHFTLAFMRDDNGNVVTALEVPASRVYRYIAKFMVRYNGLLKWLSMTNEMGARGAQGNGYDKLEQDKLYEWAQMIISDNFRPGEPTRMLEGMERGSYLRVHGRQGQLHWENRMMDCNASHSHMAAWMSLGRAITLWAIDFARNQHTFEMTQEHLNNTKQIMQSYRGGWRRVDQNEIRRQWKEVIGYLAKYLDIANSLDALDVLEKLIENPIPAWIEKQSKKEHFSARHIEKAFGFRNRSKNTDLQEAYLKAIRSMIVPLAESLNDFHQNVAEYLGITLEQARGQYQMVKKNEIADLKFLCGRLVEM